jgi:hypothetical protein
VPQVISIYIKHRKLIPISIFLLLCFKCYHLCHILLFENILVRQIGMYSSDPKRTFYWLIKRTLITHLFDELQ